MAETENRKLDPDEMFAALSKKYPTAAWIWIWAE